MVRARSLWIVAALACRGARPDERAGHGGAEESGASAEDSGGDPSGGDPDTAALDGVPPTEADGRWTFRSDALVLEVDPAVGGRVTALTHDGVALLTGPATDSDNYGATFWTSPQSGWGWPPPAAIDTAPYTVRLDGATLVLGSGAADVHGGKITVEKAIAVREDVVTQRYTVTNVGVTDVSLAGWQVARVPSGGLTVFPAGDHVTTTLGSLSYVEEGGAVWVAETPIADAKVIADGSGGFVAHVTGGVLLRVDATDIATADVAPGEGEVEIFARGGGGYVEIEHQGPYTTLVPGAEMVWDVRWTVATLPADVDVGVGSASLLAFLVDGDKT